jgi:Family of unknown function (DUF6314)
VIRLADFTGRWRITRQIDDHHAGVAGQFAGWAEFVAGGDGLVLTETGRLCYGGAAPMRAERRYIWRADGPGVAVFFADGRPFHWFSTAAPEAHHDCPPDTYDVAYDFGAWPCWKSRWAVTGPRKDYVMQSRYDRAGGAGR